MTDLEASDVRQSMLAGDKSEMPGFVRASFGLYNTVDEVDRFAQALVRVAGGEYSGRYRQDRASGEYKPDGWAPDFAAFLQWGTPARRPAVRVAAE
jgi:hypothetical protein